MKYKTGIVALSVLLSIALCAIIFFHYGHSPAVECHSNVRIFSHDSEMKLLFSYSMKNGSGAANIAGTIFKDEKKLGTISRTVTFMYTENNNVFTMRSIDVAHSSLDTFDNRFLSQYLPRFYLYKDVSLIITVTPQTRNGWVFSTGKVPSFYCEKKG